jgi:dihydrofolate reductase
MAKVFKRVLSAVSHVVSERRVLRQDGAAWWRGHQWSSHVRRHERLLTHSVPEHRTVGPTPQTFVLDGIESAVAQATEAANGKDVSVMGSAPVQECVRAGLLDEIHIHLIPVLLGGGVRLFDHLGTEPTQLECIGVVDAPGVTHLSYRVLHS